MVIGGLRFCLTAAALALASTCATPTPYQPARDTYGYAENAISEREWEVTFRGNSDTSHANVEMFLLYRAAEIAKRERAPAFRVIGQQTEILEIIVPSPCYSPYYMTHFADSATATEEDLRASARIELLKDESAFEANGVFMTDKILSDLAPCID